MQVLWHIMILSLYFTLKKSKSNLSYKHELIFVFYSFIIEQIEQKYSHSLLKLRSLVNFYGEEFNWDKELTRYYYD